MDVSHLYLTYSKHGHTIKQFDKLPIVGICYLLEVNVKEGDSYIVCLCCSLKIKNDDLILHLRSLPHVLHYLKREDKEKYLQYKDVDKDDNEATAKLLEVVAELDKTRNRRIAVCNEENKSKSYDLLNKSLWNQEHIITYNGDDWKVINEAENKNTNTNSSPKKSALKRFSRYDSEKESRDERESQGEKESKGEKDADVPIIHERKFNTDHQTTIRDDPKPIPLIDSRSIQHFLSAAPEIRYPPSRSIFLNCNYSYDVFMEILDIFMTYGDIERFESIIKGERRFCILTFDKPSIAQQIVDKFHLHRLHQKPKLRMYCHMVDPSKMILFKIKYTLCVTPLVPDLPLKEYIRSFFPEDPIVSIHKFPKDNLLLVHFIDDIVKSLIYKHQNASYENTKLTFTTIQDFPTQKSPHPSHDDPEREEKKIQLGPKGPGRQSNRDQGKKLSTGIILDNIPQSYKTCDVAEVLSNYNVISSIHINRHYQADVEFKTNVNLKEVEIFWNKHVADYNISDANVVSRTKTILIRGLPDLNYKKFGRELFSKFGTIVFMGFLKEEKSHCLTFNNSASAESAFRQMNGFRFQPDVRFEATTLSIVPHFSLYRPQHPNSAGVLSKLGPEIPPVIHPRVGPIQGRPGPQMFPEPWDQFGPRNTDAVNRGGLLPIPNEYHPFNLPNPSNNDMNPSPWHNRNQIPPPPNEIDRHSDRYDRHNDCSRDYYPNRPPLLDMPPHDYPPRRDDRIIDKLIGRNSPIDPHRPGRSDDRPMDRPSTHFLDPHSQPSQDRPGNQYPNAMLNILDKKAMDLAHQIKLDIPIEDIEKQIEKILEDEMNRYLDDMESHPDYDKSFETFKSKYCSTHGAGVDMKSFLKEWEFHFAHEINKSSKQKIRYTKQYLRSIYQNRQQNGPNISHSLLPTPEMSIRSFIDNSFNNDPPHSTGERYPEVPKNREDKHRQSISERLSGSNNMEMHGSSSNSSRTFSRFDIANPYTAHGGENNYDSNRGHRKRPEMENTDRNYGNNEFRNDRDGNFKRSRY